MKVDLAEEGHEGSVWLCHHCDDIHVRWQNLTVTLTRPQFEKFSRMAESAAQTLGRGRSDVSASRRPLAAEKPWLQ